MLTHQVSGIGFAARVTDLAPLADGLVIAACDDGVRFGHHHDWFHLPADRPRHLVLEAGASRALVLGEATRSAATSPLQRSVHLLDWSAVPRPTLTSLGSVAAERWSPTWDGERWCVITQERLRVMRCVGGRFELEAQAPLQGVLGVDQVGRQVLVRRSGEQAGIFMLATLPGLVVSTVGVIESPKVAFPHVIVGLVELPPVVTRPVYVLERITDRSAVAVVGSDRSWSVPLAGVRVGASVAGSYAAVATHAAGRVVATFARLGASEPVAVVALEGAERGAVRVLGERGAVADDRGRVVVLDLGRGEVLYSNETAPPAPEPRPGRGSRPG